MTALVFFRLLMSFTSRRLEIRGGISMDKGIQTVSEQFREELREIISSLDQDVAQPDTPSDDPLREAESYINSIHMRMAGIATLLDQNLRPDDTLREYLALFKKDIILAFVQFVPLLLA